MTIFDINYWAAGTNYDKNYFILVNSYYYYATQSHLSGGDFNTDLNAGKWAGITSDGTDTKPQFIWRPSYNYTNNNQPKIKQIVFGDGFSQTLKDGINNSLLAFDFLFELRDLKETTAILHFLTQRAGAQSFFFQAPDPYGVLKKWLCKQWQEKQSFYENYTVSVHFEEVLI